MRVNQWFLPYRKVAAVWFSLVALFFSACATADHGVVDVPEIRHGILKGYLDEHEWPNSYTLLPAAPELDSAIQAGDFEINKKFLAAATPERVALAVNDSNLYFPAAANTFSCALGIAVDEENTPHLYMLLRRSLADAGMSTYAAKNKYQRKRPFMVKDEPLCTPEDAEYLRNDGSYPSGHTAIGWAWALILTEVAPQQTDAILSRGWAFGESRMFCNAHWNSDLNMGRMVAAAAVARLHANAEFRKDMGAAKKEYQAALQKGLKPTVDCTAESAALKTSLSKPEN